MHLLDRKVLHRTQPRSHCSRLGSTTHMRTLALLHPVSTPLFSEKKICPQSCPTGCRPSASIEGFLNLNKINPLSIHLCRPRTVRHAIRLVKNKKKPGGGPNFFEIFTRRIAFRTPPYPRTKFTGRGLSATVPVRDAIRLVKNKKNLDPDVNPNFFLFFTRPFSGKLNYLKLSPRDVCQFNFKSSPRGHVYHRHAFMWFLVDAPLRPWQSLRCVCSNLVTVARDYAWR